MCASVVVAGLVLGAAPTAAAPARGWRQWPPRAYLLRSLTEAVPQILAQFHRETGRFGTEPWICTDQNVLLPLAAAWWLEDRANPWYHDARLLDAIARGGDALVDDMDAQGMWTFRKKDHSTWGQIHMPWTYSRWIRAYALVRDALPPASREKWERGLLLGFGGIRKYMDGEVHNIPAHHAMALYIAGACFGNREWQGAAAAFLRRVVRSQDPVGFWSEHSGPVVGYNRVYVDALGVYYHFSRDVTVLEALRRSARFHAALLWPDGSSVAAVDERQIYHKGVDVGNVGMSWTPEGRGFLLKQLARYGQGGERLVEADYAASMLLYGGRGKAVPLPSEGDRGSTTLGKGDALIRRHRPWQWCLSGYTCRPTDNRWIQDRQNMVDVYHDALGVVLGGGNTKLQPYWSTFTVGDPSLLRHTPGDESPNFVPNVPLRWTPDAASIAREGTTDVLALTYGDLACRVSVAPQPDGSLALTYQAPQGRQVEAHLPLLRRADQLRLANGHTIPLGDGDLLLRAAEMGDRILYGDLEVSVPPGAELRWPARQHNPYAKDGRSPLEDAKLVLVLPFTETDTQQVTLSHRPVTSSAAEYLGELRDRITGQHQSWGVLAFDTATHAPGQSPLPIRIAGKEYARGLGTHAHSEVTFDLDGEYQAFEADIGLHWEERGQGSVVFQVYVDGRKQYDSGVMRTPDAPRPIWVPVKGARELRLVVTDAGDGITCDGANWANARLVRDPSAPPRWQVAREPMDIAPFARVVTCDPGRLDGARSGRLEEFRAEDIFLEHEIARSRGGYQVPAWPDGRGCIGLQWPERRVLTRLALEFSGGQCPPVEGVQVQYWSSQGRVDDWGAIGQTLWQGRWEPLPGTLAQRGSQWVFDVGPEVPEFTSRAGVQKVRWVLPPGERPVRVKRLVALTNGRWDVAELRLQTDPAKPGQHGTVEMYNGYLIDGDPERLSLRRQWDLSRPIRLRVRYTRIPRLPDRTLLRIRLPGGAFSVAVEDVLARGCVYVPHFGFFATTHPAKTSLAAYRRRVARQRTVLERVRALPDQTFERARAKLLNPASNRDPVMLSLACDNRKVIVQREGRIEAAALEVTPSLDGDGPPQTTRRPEAPWMPIPVITSRRGSIVCRQRTFVAPFDAGVGYGPNGWLRRQALCVAEFVLENAGNSAAEARLALGFRETTDKAGPTTRPLAPDALQAVPGGVAVVLADRLGALVAVEGAAPLQARRQDGTLVVEGTLDAGARARLFIYLPLWEARPEEHAALRDGDALLEATGEYWQQVLGPAMRVEVPEPLVADVFQASQAHILMAARSEAEGRLVVPWCAANAYGPLDTESQPVILAMDLLGHHEFARRALDYFFTRYNSRGCLANGYTLMGTGQNLWTVGQHAALTGDAEWVRQVAPRLIQACRWIEEQRAKTMARDARGNRVPEYGLAPPGVLADWERYAYYFYANGYYYAGMQAVAEALARIGDPAARSLARQAAAYKRDILRAYRWNQARMPVLPLANGTWVPGYPSSVYCFGLTRDFYSGVSAIGHDVEVGGNHLLELGVLDPCGSDGDWITDYMEDAWFFLHPGLANYPADEMARDWFTYGGFAKLQPYYTRYADVLALRDEVKPFVRNYINTLFPMLSMETLALWEHFNTQGQWNKTHETAWLLQQTRTMLLMERGEALWLAPFVTSNWMRDGMVVAVSDAPTRFGPVSYRIESHVAQGYVQVSVAPPTRSRPREVVVRLRHPEGKPIRSAEVKGGARATVDAARECVVVRGAAGPFTLRASY